MVKCANCNKAANYTNADPGVNPVNYCASCLPLWLRQRASQGHFPLVTPITNDSIEEPVIETPPVSAAPKKKTTKKTAKSIP